MITNPEKLKKLKIIEGVLNTFKSNGYTNVKRAQLIHTCAREGLVEKDTYPVMREWTKASTRSYYVVAAMLREIETKVTGKVLTKAVKRRTGGEDMSKDLGGQIPYTENDIREELSIMGTRISSI
jgi:hypothetical protein